jgi:hypothetical protein
LPWQQSLGKPNILHIGNALKQLRLLEELRDALEQDPCAAAIDHAVIEGEKNVGGGGW